eukprot:scaffold1869_cov122-Cylindrotheca_fusiformis.AAC.42
MTAVFRFLIVILYFSVGCAKDQVLSLVSSSQIRMDLSPTVDRLNSTAATRVELAIKSVLVLASSGTGSFDQVFDVDIVLQKIEWGVFDAATRPSTLVQFEVHMAFFNDVGALPTRFALDSLISRTFSQPSTKSTFLSTLELSQEPTLAEVDSVNITVLEDPSDAENPSENEPRSVSDLDVVLISASILMFLGVIYVICQYHKDKAQLEEEQTRNFDEWTQQSRKTRARIQNTNPDFDLNETGITSMQSDDKSNPGTEGTTRPSDTNSEKRPSPPISPCASFPMSPGEINDSENDPSATKPTLHQNGTISSNSDSIGVLTNMSLQVKPASSLGQLGARLSSLPLMNPNRPIRRRFSQSSVSGADGLVKSMSDVSASKESSVGDMSSVFKMSTASSNGEMSSIFKAPGKRRGSNQKSQGSMSSKSHASSEQTRRVANRCFKNNWSESRRKAIEDDEQSSAEDVFHVDVEAHDSVDDNQSRLSGFSTVSEWIKSIRVVGSHTGNARSTAGQSSSAKSLNLDENESTQDSAADSSSAATAPI